MTLFKGQLKFQSYRFPNVLIQYFLSFTVIILFLLLQISTAHSAQATLAWDSNAEPDLAGYKIYYGTSANNYTTIIDVGKITTYTLSSLGSGITYYAVSTAYDTQGYESGYSNELNFTTASACTYSISPNNQSFDSSGGAGTVSVTTQSGCNWTVASNASWLVITSNSSVMGNGVVNYSVSANTDVSSRTGTLTVAGQTFTVNQSGVVQYTLTITKAGTGAGAVTNSPTGTSFNAGTVVTLTATPDSSSTFSGWSGGYTGTSSTCSVTMNANTSVTATFTLKTYTVTATAGTNGSISPSGAVSVNHGANQSFSITPNTGYGIADVKVDGASVGKVSSYTFSNVTANHTLEASFSVNISSYTLTITKAGTGAGAVTNSPTGTSFNAGTVVTLTATPDSSSTFSGWSGGYTGTSSTCSVTMNANTSVTATFTLKTYTVTATAGTNGSISPSGAVSVNHGANQSFSITPNTGYGIADVKVDGASVGKVSSYTFSNVTANHTLEASFSVNISSYTLTITKAGTGAGAVTNSPTGTSFNAGTVVTLTATPDSSSTFSGWSGGYTGTSSTCSVTMNANTSVTATFTLKTYTVTATAGTNGSISPSGAVSVNHGANQSFSITPNTGYGIADVKVDGASVGKVSSYTFSNVTANHTLEVSFSVNISSYTLTITKAGTGAGAVTNSPTGTSFNAGTVVTLTATPDSSSTFSGWSGGYTGTSSTCSVTMNANTSVTATFTLKTYTVTATVEGKGSISPSGEVIVSHGESKSFTIKPKLGYKIIDVEVDGVSVGKLSSYTFTNVTANHTIKAIFNVGLTWNLNRSWANWKFGIN